MVDMGSSLRNMDRAAHIVNIGSSRLRNMDRTAHIVNVDTVGAA
jgi:hypothetical protein